MWLFFTVLILPPRRRDIIIYTVQKNKSQFPLLDTTDIRKEERREGREEGRGRREDGTWKARTWSLAIMRLWSAQAFQRCKSAPFSAPMRAFSRAKSSDAPVSRLPLSFQQLALAFGFGFGCARLPSPPSLGSGCGSGAPGGDP